MWTLQDAKNRFSAVVDAALRGEPQEVSRRGKPAVVVLSMQDYTRLRKSARAAPGGFKAHLLSIPKDDGLPSDRAQAAPREVEF